MAEGTRELSLTGNRSNSHNFVPLRYRDKARKAYLSHKFGIRFQFRIVFA